jgi:hypothetical protein
MSQGGALKLMLAKKTSVYDDDDFELGTPGSGRLNGDSLN